MAGVSAHTIIRYLGHGCPVGVAGMPQRSFDRRSAQGPHAAPIGAAQLALVLAMPTATDLPMVYVQNGPVRIAARALLGCGLDDLAVVVLQVPAHGPISAVGTSQILL